MMEVDTHSPSRIFNYSLKRPRSPDSPSQERQAKRPTLALEDGYLNLRPHSSFFSASQSLNDHHQPSPEDWVRRASDLSIGTPLSGGPVPSPSGDIGQAGQDVNMALDIDKAAKSCSAVLVSPSPLLQSHPPAQQLIASQTYNIPPQHLIHQPVTSPSPSSIVAEPAGAYTQHHISPDASSNQQEMQSGPPQNHDLFATISSGTPIPSPPSPLISQYLGQISSSGRKQRFTMGPRADCLKCRTGVKGHWMHFD
ncbi:hypothetical protein M405DRAFT_855201 [Rhizopogon salebrosus TDB-379]|nr:hypothetical protein M405DRAFT_855201 [Rhizopogon salebrosus TDB-379]